MWYINTEDVIGQPCRQCGQTILFSAFEISGLTFCTIQCAFDYARDNREAVDSDINFESPDTMTRRPSVTCG
jgi:hypothetical protein